MIWKLPLGDLLLYAIEDGAYHVDPVAVFPRSDPDAWEKGDRAPDGTIRMSLGCFLLADRDRVVMIDSGMGRFPEAPPDVRAEVGAMPRALERLSISPAEVEMVVHTHLHADHFGGDVTDQGEAFFPNARIVCHRADLDHFRRAEDWLGERVREEFLPLVEEGRVELVEGPGKLVPGIEVQETPGHTPGHLSVLLSSDRSQAMVIGDVTHHPFQVTHPDWSSAGDLHPEQATKTRADLLKRLAESSAVVAGGHYPKPGFGRVVVDRMGYRFVPLERTAP